MHTKSRTLPPWGDGFSGVAGEQVRSEGTRPGAKVLGDNKAGVTSQ